MSDPERKSIDQIFQEGDPIDRAVNESVKEAVSRHKLLGNPIVVWREGKAVLVPAEEISIEDDVAVDTSNPTR